MRNKKGISGVLLVVLVGGLLAIAGSLVFLTKSGGSGQPSTNIARDSSSAAVLPALSKGDSVGELESDVNSTKFDDIDRDLNNAAANLNF